MNKRALAHLLLEEAIPINKKVRYAWLARQFNTVHVSEMNIHQVDELIRVCRELLAMKKKDRRKAIATQIKQISLEDFRRFVNPSVHNPL